MENKSQKEIIAALEAQVQALLKQHEEDELRHRKDQERIAYLQELISMRTRTIFAKKAEQSSGEQLSLFDDIELAHCEAVLEEKIEHVKAHDRKPKRKDLVNSGSLPVVTETYDFESPAEGSVHIGYKTVRKLIHKPEEFYILEQRYETRKIEDEYGTVIISTAPENLTDDAFSDTMIDTSVVSHVIYSKTVMALPLYRQEQDLARKGINLSRQTMSNAVFKAYDAIKPVTDLIADYIIKADNCRADETRLNIIGLNGDKARLANPDSAKTSYVWLYMTATGYHPAYCYRVGPSRKYSVPAAFFGTGTDRYLQTDDYGAYFRLENVINVPCWAHIRRYFVTAQKSGRHDYQTFSGKMIAMIDTMFKAEDIILSDLSSMKEDEKYYIARCNARKRTVKPIMESIYKELDAIKDSVLPKSLLAKAVNYALDLKEDIFHFFDDGRLTLTNNQAEREGIKPLVIGRKNWMFSDTVKGAEVTCGMYSLIETALHNNLNPEKYVSWLLGSLPYQERKDFDYTIYLPWSESIPDDIKLNKTK